MTAQGLVYTITCRSCGNEVEVTAAAYNAAGTVRCACGSEELDVRQPPPSTAELMMAVRQLKQTCALCGSSGHPGWVDVGDGQLFPCRACQGV
jgi:hypothetical protein